MARLLHFVNKENGGFREFIYLMEGDSKEDFDELVKNYAENEWELSGEIHIDEDELGGFPVEREMYG